MIDVEAPIFTQAELCKITGLDNGTVDSWLLRGILETTKVGGRALRGRRLFSVAAIFQATVIAELVARLAIPPSEAAKVARCDAVAEWTGRDDWKSRTIQVFERSAKVTSVFLLIVRADDDWKAKEAYGKNAPLFEPRSIYEKWLALPFIVLPASELLSSVYKKCMEMYQTGKDELE
jgi:hypothetical protein